MRLPPVPAWFPLRALALQGVAALGVLLFCLAPLRYCTWKLEAEIKELENRIQVQETLQPLMEGLNARREETRRLLGAAPPLPTPDTLPLILASLPEMVSLSGPPENFRRLVLLLSEQPWLSGMEFLNVTPSEAHPAYSLGIWATFTQPANILRH